MSSTLPCKVSYQVLRTLVSGAQIIVVSINMTKVYSICYQCRPDEICRRHRGIAAAINSHLMGARIDAAIKTARSDAGTNLGQYQL